MDDVRSKAAVILISAGSGLGKVISSPTVGQADPRRPEPAGLPPGPSSVDVHELREALAVIHRQLLEVATGFG